MDYATQLTQPFVGEAFEREARVEQRLARAPFLAEPLRRLGYDCSEGWAWDNYRPTVLGLCKLSAKRAPRPRAGSRTRNRRRPRAVADPGGGGRRRRRIKSPSTISTRANCRWPRRVQQGAIRYRGQVDPSWEGRFDLIFSRMVVEHVKGAPRAWAICTRFWRPAASRSPSIRRSTRRRLSSIGYCRRA